jgi:hypothetical protein
MDVLNKQVICGALSVKTSWKQSQSFAYLVEMLLKGLHFVMLDAEIISTLQRRIYGDSIDATSSDLESDEEEKWRRWVDNHLVHLLSPNIYRTPKEALEAFDYLTTNGMYSSQSYAHEG